MKERQKQSNRQDFVEEIYNQYKVPLLCVIRKYIVEKDAIEDVFQEVIIRIIQNVDLLSRLPRPKLEAYIFLVARGVSIDYLRSASKKEEISIESDFVLDLLSRDKRQAVTQSDPIRKADIIIMMEKIPAEEKILLIGKYYLGLSTKELIDFVGGSPATIRSKVFRARKKLLEEWTQAGLRMGDFLDE